MRVETFPTSGGLYGTNVWCNDGRVVFGRGCTEAESKRAALALAALHNEFLSSSPEDRLRQLLSRVETHDHLCAVDVTYAIKAIAEILLKEKVD